VTWFYLENLWFVKDSDLPKITIIILNYGVWVGGGGGVGGGGRGGCCGGGGGGGGGGGWGGGGSGGVGRHKSRCAIRLYGAALLYAMHENYPLAEEDYRLPGQKNGTTLRSCNENIFLQLDKGLKALKKRTYYIDSTFNYCITGSILLRRNALHKTGQNCPAGAFLWCH